MSEDDAFVARLRANPDDETARLVYADFLDEREDPRGAYLRAEAAWVALQPAHEEYRPLYRELSQRAAALDPAWLVSASRVGHLVRRECAPGPSFTVPPQADPQSALAELRALCTEAFGAGASERFCLPVDFLALVVQYGGAHNHATHYASAQGLVLANRTNVCTFYSKLPLGSEMWIEFGGVEDNVFHFVCADLGSPLFGVTAEGKDYHPWMDGIEPLQYRGRNLLHFFSGFVTAVRGCDPWWNVPHSEWATH
jgi:uncharacterized protein (TIGR02996 family)